ncbi:MAG: threonine/serine exporter ThrE family protein [Vulcanibacillus sp.]
MRADINQVLEVCLLTGEIMLSNGGETYRVEDTITRKAKSYHMSQVYSFVTPTGIFLTIEEGIKEQSKTKFIRIFERTIDLNKVTLANDISRKISEERLTIEEAYSALVTIEQMKSLYPIWLRTIAAGVASGFFALMFGGEWLDYIPAFVAGSIGYVVFINLHRLVRVKFISEIVSSFTIGIIASTFIFFGVGINIEKIIIGAIMQLVPGLMITNAVRDLMAGDLVSGTARGAEALLTALAIGVGIAAVISLL